jgi:hypothetical protein
VHCHSCRTFTDSIGRQRVAIVALVPLFAAPHALGMTGGGSVLGGGITGMKAALAGVLAAATVGVSAGGVAVWNPSHAHPVPSHIAAAVGPTAGGDREHEQSADAAEPAEAPETLVSAGDTAETGDKTGADTQSETASGQSIQFASTIEPDDGAGSGLVATTTTHRTARQHESEAGDNPHQLGSEAPRDT